MSADNAMVQRFLTALRESEEVVPEISSGGYVADLDDGHCKGATIDGWWTAEQLQYAIRGAMTEEATSDGAD
ncbi:hypothetical protein SEA_TEMPO_8 [Microbacterium phage Tempo]|nr:hypothetical protein SEA_TEMPO_8 [Microbacterium phage Tempo]QKO02760.1 hypothetical protein SEA_KELCOLE_7 [Microbacterium phage Kelcole]UOW92752.1 hypothetical protein SEA_ROBINROSE_9 [Microbacterium phage RobinRose]